MISAIYGAGAMGTVLGAYLSRAGEQVDLINRNVGHIKGLKEHGAQIVGQTQFTQKVHALLPQEMKKQYDIIFLMTKQLDNASIVKSLVPFLKKDGVICTMQNGLPELSVSKIIGEEKTIGCAMAWGATLIGNGVSELTSEATKETLSFSLGSFGNVDNLHFQEVKRLLEIMGNVDVESNWIGARWAKLLVNSAFSGLSAILNATFGEVAKDKTSRKLVQKVIKECIDVANIAGIKIEPIQGKDIVKLLDWKGPIKKAISFMIIPIAIKKHQLLKSSMLQDLSKGKKCEIEAINGVVCEYGDQVSIATPISDRIVEIVHKIEANQLKPDWSNLTLFSDL
ncbi:MAG: 2-dehydropantoate 2-reductase [Firmicutes bacterium]|nr:2-dehydropantoate 2-reductase [Bacillota bacterium]